MYDVGLGTAVGVVRGGRPVGMMQKGCGWVSILYTLVVGCYVVGVVLLFLSQVCGGIILFVYRCVRLVCDVFLSQS